MRKIKILEDKIYSKIIFWGASFLLLLMPLHPFLMMSLRHFLGLPQIIQAWKELLIFGLFCFFVAKQFKEKNFSSWDIIDKAIFLYFFIAFFSVLINKITPLQAIFGAKYDLEFLLLFLIIKNTQFEKDAYEKILNFYFAIFALVILFGFLQTFFFPVNFLINFGYSPVDAFWGHSADRGGKIPAVWNDFGIPRTFSFISSPNSFGFFVAIGIFFLIFYLIFSKEKQKNKKIFVIFLLILAAICLAYSFSRSAWLGFFIASIFGFGLIFYLSKIFHEKYNKIIFYFLLASSVFLIMFLSLFLKYNLFDKKNFQLIFLHGSYHRETGISGSTKAHLESFKRFNFWEESFWGKIIGIGLGKVNAAATNFKNGYSVESWYFQVLGEMGILGFLTYLSIIFLIFYFLLHFLPEIDFKNITGILILGVLTGFSVMTTASFFIPAWFDSSNTLPFWTLAGFAFSYLKEKEIL